MIFTCTLYNPDLNTYCRVEEFESDKWGAAGLSLDYFDHPCFISSVELFRMLLLLSHGNYAGFNGELNGNSSGEVMMDLVVLTATQSKNHRNHQIDHNAPNLFISEFMRVMHGAFPDGS